MKTIKLIVTVALSLIIGFGSAQESNGQTKKVAIMNIESSELMQDANDLAKMARLRLQQKSDYMVFREHDMKEYFINDMNSYNNCYSVKCLQEAGKLIGADLMLSGSAERFGERIVINLILVDVESGEIIKSDVNEYYNLGGELEGMIEISINNLLGLESDALLENSLVSSGTVLSDQVVERLSLNGPRMGMSYIMGLRGRRLQDSESEYGYDMYPLISQFGYQFEWQYLSAGNLQALIEVIPMIGGMDQQAFIPSLTLMNGFRHSRSGIEFAFGPTFRAARMARGFYDESGKWQRAVEFDESKADTYQTGLHDNIDSKGATEVEYSFTLAAGKTIQSGHLNIPINVFYSPGKNGGLLGASFGFNIRKR